MFAIKKNGGDWVASVRGGDCPYVVCDSVDYLTIGRNCWSDRATADDTLADWKAIVAGKNMRTRDGKRSIVLKAYVTEIRF